EFSPREDGPPRFATAAKVAYDDRNFYAFIRAFDPHPDSILKILARRDVRAPTDQLKIVIDSYHDRRTGYEFAVNPAGVKRDYAIYNDNNEDDAWDGVWEVAATVDSLGWTAEFRIPLSQLRYAHADTNTFGFAVWRDIQRYTERVSWPVYRQSQSGFASQLGDVTGLVGLPAPRRLEVAPYMVTKNVSVPVGPGFAHRHHQLRRSKGDRPAAGWSDRGRARRHHAARHGELRSHHRARHQLCGAARAAGFPQGTERRRRDVHGGEPQSRPADRRRAAPQRLCWRGGLSAPVPGEPLSGLGLARPQP